MPTIPGNPPNIAAHLRGKHNQKSHGNRYRNGVPIPGRGLFRAPDDVIRQAGLYTVGKAFNDRRVQEASEDLREASDADRPAATRRFLNTLREAVNHEADRYTADDVARLERGAEPSRRVLPTARAYPEMQKALADYADVVRAAHLANSPVDPPRNRTEGEQLKARREQLEKQVRQARQNLDQVLDRILTQEAQRRHQAMESGRDTALVEQLPPVPDEAAIRRVEEMITPPAEPGVTPEETKLAEAAREAAIDAAVQEHITQAINKRLDPGAVSPHLVDAATDPQRERLRQERRQLAQLFEQANTRAQQARDAATAAREALDTARKAREQADKEQSAAVMADLRQKVPTLPDENTARRQAQQDIRKELKLPGVTRAKQLSRSRDQKEQQLGSAADSIYHQAALIGMLRRSAEHTRNEVRLLEERLAQGGLRPAVERGLRRLLRRGRNSLSSLETDIQADVKKLDDLRARWRRLNSQVEARKGPTMPNPNPTIVHAAAKVSVDDIRTAFYRQAPSDKVWIRELHLNPLRLIVANDADGGIARVDVTVTDNGEIKFSRPTPVKVEYVEQTTVAASAADDDSRLVYASRAESRPTLDALNTLTTPPPPPGFTPAAGGGADPPATEPGNPNHEEDEMPLAPEVLTRLGLAYDATPDQVATAITDLLSDYEELSAQQQVAAAAADENQQLTKQVELLTSQVETLSQQVAASAAEKANQVKQALFDDAIAQGKITPAARSQWENDYDAAPEVVQRVLASIAPGTAAPVAPVGRVGEPIGASAAHLDGEGLEPEPSWLFPPDSDSEEN